MENNVSVEKIQAGIDYLESQFMKPLVTVGEELIDNYKALNQSLQSETINQLIQEQQSKLDELKNELSTICNKAKGQMEDSSNIIQQNQANIDNDLASI